MQNIIFTKHALDMIKEREISESWIKDTITNPDYTEIKSNEEIHYIKQIKENGNRFLRVVVNLITRPNKIVTVFFDRRLK
ncbi:MAG: DUF4258 domain-containing protein [Candidatus Kapabacteria bacterium]|nr:DUF4258 domain-containing protein [Candidatus Kapabacteria bacterium]